MIGVFLQARMASRRFPGKVLASLGGIPILEHAMKRLSRIPADVFAVLTDLPSLQHIDPLVRRNPPWDTFVGDSDDVMRRYIEAAAFYGVTTIVRATGDNPLVDPEAATYLLGVHMRGTADATHPLGMSRGTAVEIVEVSALRDLHGVASRHDREHVMPLVYEVKPANVLWLHDTYRGESVSVDTPEDLERVGGIWKSESL